MTHNFVFDNLRSGYVKLTDYTARYGEQVSDKFPGLVLGNVGIQIDDIYPTLPLGIGRKWNLKLAAVRALTLLSGSSRPDLEVAAAPALGNYLDNGSLPGCPGEMIGFQLANIIDILSSNPTTENAIVSLFNPSTGKAPRVINFGFDIRNGELHMFTLLHTADLWLELVYDIFSLTQVQHTVARFLGLPPGSFTANVWSLTLQEKHVPLCVTLHEPRTSWAFQPSGVVDLSDYRALDLRDTAYDLLDWPSDRQLNDEQESELWYQRHMLRVHRLLDNND